MNRQNVRNLAQPPLITPVFSFGPLTLGAKCVFNHRAWFTSVEFHLREAEWSRNKEAYKHATRDLNATVKMEDAVVIRVKREKDANDTLALAETAASTTLKAISLAPGTVGDNSASSAEETHSNESELWLVGDNGRLVKLVDINTRINFTEHNR